MKDKQCKCGTWRGYHHGHPYLDSAEVLRLHNLMNLMLLWGYTVKQVAYASGHSRWAVYRHTRRSNARTNQ